ncbi:MAG: hypothetical protein K2N03_07410 [Muribaculaceae bacterium]|nr:hypothetical protein [Muribaculaceae bacterium]
MPWYAIRSRRIFEAERTLAPLCQDSYLPKEKVRDVRTKGLRERAIIPRLMFIKTTEPEALDLEVKSRDSANKIEPFFLYRNVAGTRPSEVTQREMDLMMLLTADDDRKCEIYHKDNIREGDRIRVISGPFEGYEGYARRIRKNKHVVVEIEGLCAIALPYIHPALLEKIEE